jgi:hypothetical protein
MALSNQSFDSSGNAFSGDPVVLVTPGTVQTASGNVGGVGSSNYGTLRLTLNVTAASGTTPSLTVNVQTSQDNATWSTIASFPAATAVGTSRKVFNGVDRYTRATTTITGTTPSFTFGVTGEGI